MQKKFLRACYSTRVHLFRVGYGVVAALWACLVLVSATASAQAAEELVAQKPFTSTVIDGMALTKDKNGVPLAVTMPRGVNAPLEIINVKTMRRTSMAEQRTDGQESTGRAYVTLSNRRVIVGTSTGVLYTVNPDTTVVTEEVAPSTKPQSYTQAVLGDSGTVYLLATTSTGNVVYAYRPDTTNWRELVRLPTAQSMAYEDGVLYVASEASQTVWRIQTATGTKTELTLANIPVNTTGLRVAAAWQKYLYVTTIGTSPKTLIYDMAHNAAQLDQQPAFGAVSLPAPLPVTTLAPTPATDVPVPSPQSSSTPSVTTGTPSSSSPEQPTNQTPSASSSSASQTGTAPSPGVSSANKPPANPSETTSPTQTTPQAPVSLPATPSATSTPSVAGAQTQLATVTAPEPVVSETPPSPLVYYGALRQYDPMSKLNTTVTNGQDLQPAQGNCWIDTVRCVVYSQQGRFGVVHAGTKSIKMSAPSPVIGGFQGPSVLSVSGDDTLYAASSTPQTAVLQVPREKNMGKMITGPSGAVTSLLPVDTTMLAGTSTGALASYNTKQQSAPATFTHEAQAGPGAVTALARAGTDGVAYALSQPDTQTTGALGLYSPRTHAVTMTPQTVLPDQSITSLVHHRGILFAGGAVSAKNPAQTAQLVAYDIATRAVIAKTSPVPGAQSISSLAIGPNGHVYGVAGSTLFEADPHTLTVIRTKAFYAQDIPGTVVFSRNQLIASVAGKIYTLSLDDFRETQVATGARLAVSPQGQYYYVRDGALYRMTGVRSATTPAATVSSNASGFALTTVDVKLGASTLGLIAMLIAIPVFTLHHRRIDYNVRR